MSSKEKNEGNKATRTWKFIQCHFIASKLNAGFGGYLDKIYKILVDILDLNKAVFPLANLFIRSNFFHSKKKLKVGLDPAFFTAKNVVNQWEFSKKLLRVKKIASGKQA